MFSSTYRNKVFALAIALQIGQVEKDGKPQRPRPVILWGGPGTGKTSMINALGEELKLHVETVIGSISEPSDIAGIPTIQQGKIECDSEIMAKALSHQYGLTVEEARENLPQLLHVFGNPYAPNNLVRIAPPRWVRELQKAAKSGRGGLFFADELSTARPSVQVTMLNIFYGGRVGDEFLPKTSMVAAANPPDSISGGYNLTGPLANRLCHMKWEVDPDSWLHGMTYGWSVPKFLKLPSDWRETHLDQAKLDISSYLSIRKEKLDPGQPAEEVQAGLAWASPRTWEASADMLAASRAAGAPDEVSKLLVQGCIGAEGFELFTYLEELDLPSPEYLLENFKDCPIPDRDDQRYAALGSVVHAVKNTLTELRWQKAWKLMARAADDKSPDIAAAHVVELAGMRPDNSGWRVPSEVHQFADLLRDSGVFKAAGGHIHGLFTTAG